MLGAELVIDVRTKGDRASSDQLHEPIAQERQRLIDVVLPKPTEEDRILIIRIWADRGDEITLQVHTAAFPKRDHLQQFRAQHRSRFKPGTVFLCGRYHAVVALEQGSLTGKASFIQ